MKKNILLIFILIIGIFALLFNFNPTAVRTDSGWDNDYSSSSSSSSDDSYSIPISGDSDIEFGESKHTFNLTYEQELAIILSILIIMLFILYYYSPLRYKLKHKGEIPKKEKIVKVNYNDISLITLKKYLPEYSLKELKQELYKRFVDIQTAWACFDYDYLKDNCTNELYNTYKEQLKILKSKNEQNLISNFHKIDLRVIDLDCKDNLITAEVYLKVNYEDYIINTITNKVSKGLSYKPITVQYIMTFIRAKETINKVTSCPHCSSKINIVVTQECPYCNSIIVVNPNRFVLSTKKKIN